MDTPSVFVGSSTEGLDVARAVQFQLKDCAHVSIWNEGVFGLGQGSLESLVENLDRFDFAILVITPDDVVVSRDVESQTPRDNVMFEFGLFMGRLGRNRTFGLCSNSPNVKLPSDLAGVSLARYDVAHAQEDLTVAIGVACFPIRRAISDLGPLRLKPRPDDELRETYCRIELDFAGLAAEMHRQHADDLQKWRDLASRYIWACQRYQQSALDQLIEAATVDQHLRASVAQVRDLVASGFAETISLLGRKLTARKQCEQQFSDAAKRIWRMADEVRDQGDELAAGR